MLLTSWGGALLSTRSVRLPAESVAVVRVDPTPTVRDAVTGYLLAIAADARDAVQRGDVHDMRVSCRRTRSGLRAYARVWKKSEQQAARELADRARWVARHLSDARDGEVVAEVLGDWVGQDGWDQARTDAVLAALHSGGGASTEPKPAVPAPDPHAEVIAEQSAVLLDLVAHVEAFLQAASWRAAAADPAVGELVRYRRRAAERVRLRALAAHGVDPAEDPDGLWHLVRKASKRVRYTAEAAVRVDDPGAAEVVTSAKHVQTVIGDLQDARLIIDRLREATSGSEPTPAAVLAAIDRAGLVIEQRRAEIGPALEQLWATVPGLGTHPEPDGRL